MEKREPWGFCETPEEKCTMNYCDENGCQNRKRTPTESYRLDIIDVSQMPEYRKIPVRDYDIWIGFYHLGQGHHPPAKPVKVATIKASSFKIACYLYELQNEIKSLEERISRGDSYIEDIHFGKLYYDPKTNSNHWTGTYFETEQEALKTFGINS